MPENLFSRENSFNHSSKSIASGKVQGEDVYYNFFSSNRRGKPSRPNN